MRGGYEHERSGWYTIHDESGEYVTGGRSVRIQLIQWDNHAEVPGHNGIYTDDKHASRSWHHLRRYRQLSGTESL